MFPFPWHVQEPSQDVWLRLDDWKTWYIEICWFMFYSTKFKLLCWWNNLINFSRLIPKTNVLCGSKCRIYQWSVVRSVITWLFSLLLNQGLITNPSDILTTYICFLLKNELIFELSTDIQFNDEINGFRSEFCVNVW